MTTIERDLSQSIGKTLARAAHTNELRVAWIRALNLSIVTVLGTVVMNRPTLILSASFAAFAWGIVAVKRRGHYHRWALWVRRRSTGRWWRATR
jgi:hypothetical protein